MPSTKPKIALRLGVGETSVALVLPELISCTPATSRSPSSWLILLARLAACTVAAPLAAPAAAPPLPLRFGLGGGGEAGFDAAQLTAGGDDRRVHLVAVVGVLALDVGGGVGVGELLGALGGARFGGDRDEVAAAGGARVGLAAGRREVVFGAQPLVHRFAQRAGVDQRRLVGDVAVVERDFALGAVEQPLFFGPPAQVDLRAGGVDGGLALVVEVGRRGDEDPHKQDQPLAPPDRREDGRWFGRLVHC